MKLPKGIIVHDIHDLLTLVTPAVAQLLLDRHNKHNRDDNRNNVDTLAQEIREGRWIITGEAITFDKHGNLANGQHRLMAIVKSGTPCWVLLIGNVDDDAFLAADQHLPRTRAHIFQAVRIPNASRVATLMSRVERWDAGARGRDLAGGAKRGSPAFYLDLYEKKPSEIQDALRYPASITNAPGSLADTFRYIVRDSDPKLVDAYLREVHTGVDDNGIAVKGVIARVRSDLASVEDVASNTVAHYRLGVLLNGWNARGRVRDYTRFPTRSEGNPVPTPVERY